MERKILGVDPGIGDHTAIVEVGPDGIKTIMNVFYKTNPTLNWGNKTYRAAADFLVKKFGIDTAVKMAEAAVSVQGVPYAPVITNPWELKEKLLKLEIFLKGKMEAKRPVQRKQL